MAFLLAHQSAWTKAGVLHGDISWSNILIQVRPSVPGIDEAFLNDWDLCKWEEDLAFSATQPGRSVCTVSFLLSLNFVLMSELLGYLAVHVG